jgi:integrase
MDNAGKLLTPEALGKGYMRTASALGIKASLHEWRHAQATMLILAGVSVKVVSERLGHANVGITQDLYAHVLPEMQQKAVDILQVAWEATIGKDSGADGQNISTQ